MKHRLALLLRWIVKKIMELDLYLYEEKQFYTQVEKVWISNYHKPPINKELCKIFGEVRLLKMRYRKEKLSIDEVDSIFQLLTVEDPVHFHVAHRMWLKNVLVQEGLMEEGIVKITGEKVVGLVYKPTLEDRIARYLSSSKQWFKDKANYIWKNVQKLEDKFARHVRWWK